MIENFQISDLVMFSEEVYLSNFQAYLESNQYSLAVLGLLTLISLVILYFTRAKSKWALKSFFLLTSIIYICFAYYFYEVTFSQIAWYSNYLIAFCAAQAMIFFVSLFQNLSHKKLFLKSRVAILSLIIVLPIDSLMLNQEFWVLDFGPIKIALMGLSFIILIQSTKWVYLLTAIVPTTIMIHEVILYLSF